MARVSFALVAAMAAMLIVSTFAQSPAPSPSVQTPRKISPAPAQSPTTTAAPAPSVTATTPATAPTPSTDATSPPSPSPVAAGDVPASSPSSISDSPSGSPSAISDSPADAPSPAQNGAASVSFTVVGSLAVVVLASVLIWNARNSILFKKHYTTNNVEEIVEYSAAQHSQQHDTQHSEATTIPHTSHQHLPPSLSPDTPALFVDAAIDHHNGLTGAGFVFKRGYQTVLASQYRRLPGVVSPIFSEGQALLQSLKWCIDSQFSPQVVFSDCLNLVSKNRNSKMIVDETQIIY
ncbi:hypothetical protein G4B88_022259 [Cannabis sativa]|uniref:RNase H type-1 domain-containing protein n=1 Tax=Cannabis sativa TaxID=3483 RepID=A0A7J6DKJ3_CANSA|nr:hypothetical protein G4B88_022259 [Cannabis sativa]